MDTSKVNVLLVFANPYNTASLRLGAEDRAIREAVKLSKNRDNIHIITHFATTVHDLRRALLDRSFQIVQISGHGSSRGLALEDESGGLYVVPQQALAKLFQPFPSVQCVILNACYSITQGNLLAQVVPFTVAMESSLNDQAAIEFSKGFYDALGANRPIEFAYSQGCLAVELTIHHVSGLPQLLKRGEVPIVENTKERSDASKEVREQMQFRNVQALVGVAVDLSGSMAKSIYNETGEHISRLESIRQALSELTKSAHKSIRNSRGRDIQNAIDLFVYGFGLRPDTMAVCDLLSLLKASRQVITKELVETVTQRYKSEKQHTYQGYTGVGNFVRQLGLGNLVDSGEAIIKHKGQQEIRRRIWHEAREAVEEQIKKEGDTTLPIEEVAELWEDSADMLGNAEELIFGNTPITEALVSITDRFERETQRRGKDDTRLILFLVSDGKYVKADSLPLAAKLHAMGVTIFSCFVTDRDSANPRQLLHDSNPEWEQGAKLMFQMASPLDDGTEIERFLLDKGWSVHRQPKLFVQVNHSDVLKELVRVTLSQFEDPEAIHALPRGW